MKFVTVAGRGKDSDGKETPAGSARYVWDNSAAAPRRVASWTSVPSPSFLAASADGRIFATSEDSGEGRISLNDGSDKPFSGMTGGQGAVHADVDGRGRFIAVANYRGAPLGEDLSMAVFAIDETGQIGAMSGFAQHAGSGPDKGRQASPHTHCVMFSPDNRLLVAVDLGTDGLWFYRFDPDSGAIALLQEVKLPPGSGPRHCVFHPSRPFLYVACELNSTLVSLRYDVGAGTAEIIDVDPGTARPVDGRPVEGRNYPSVIAISPDGHYVMLANRGAETIATFWIDPETGLARLRDETDCGGTFPRAIRLDAAGAVLAVANQRSGNVTLFARDFASGRLTPMPHGRVELPAAMDVLFVDQ